MAEIRIKRVYEAPAPDDGFRVLVDRLWPRGISKEHAALGAWWKDIAPSPYSWLSSPRAWTRRRGSFST